MLFDALPDSESELLVELEVLFDALPDPEFELSVEVESESETDFD